VVPEDVGLANLAIRIRREHREALASARGVVLHALEAGRLLNEAKAKLRHGKWALWIEENCKFSSRTAQRYMYLANKLPDRLRANTTRVADLTMRGALDLVTAGGAPLVRDAGRLNVQTPALQKMARRVRAGDVSLPEASTLLEAYEGELIRHIEQEDFASVKQNALAEIERLAADPG
jgi:hypothetical protein